MSFKKTNKGWYCKNIHIGIYKDSSEKVSVQSAYRPRWIGRYRSKFS